MELYNKLVDDSVRVFLLVENRLLGETLDRLFHKRPDFCLIGRCSAAETGAIDIRNLQCDVLVLDHLRMASLLDVLSDAGEPAAARPRIVLISMEENEEQFFTGPLRDFGLFAERRFRRRRGGSGSRCDAWRGCLSSAVMLRAVSMHG